MSIETSILGDINQDNAVYAQLNLGDEIHRFLFDCGEGCPQRVAVQDLKQLDHLFLSHLHIDHIAGFDAFLRRVYTTPRSEPIHIWGPAKTATILHRRLRGFTWNLVNGQAGAFLVTDVEHSCTTTWRFRLADGYRDKELVSRAAFTGHLIERETYRVVAQIMDHGTPCLAYVLIEAPKTNIDKSQLQSLGLCPGAWIRRVKDGRVEGSETVAVGDETYQIQALRDLLLEDTPGDRVAYLTDFLLDEAAIERLLPLVEGAQTIICEAQYAQQDEGLARRNYHMTTRQAALLARHAGANQLVLFHVSRRYNREQRAHLLNEARVVFPRTRFPKHWHADAHSY